jgi:hypothetical protein
MSRRASTYPINRREMETSGYKYLNNSTCRSCNAPIEWWLTMNGKKVPYNMPDPAALDPLWAKAVAHFATCPNAGEHRNKPAVKQGHNVPLGLDGRTEWFRKHHEATFAILWIDDQHFALSLRPDLTPEEMTACLFHIANAARTQLEATHGNR